MSMPPFVMFVFLLINHVIDIIFRGVIRGPSSSRRLINICTYLPDSLKKKKPAGIFITIYEKSLFIINFLVTVIGITVFNFYSGARS